MRGVTAPRSRVAQRILHNSLASKDPTGFAAVSGEPPSPPSRHASGCDREESLDTGKGKEEEEEAGG
eukprot:7777008-Pyramimonas_sp.AAC.1